MSTNNSTQIKCKITDANNISIEGSLYLDSNSLFRVVIDPTKVSDELRRRLMFPVQITGFSELGEEFLITDFWLSNTTHHFHPKQTIEMSGTADIFYRGTGFNEMIEKNQRIDVQFAITPSALTSSAPSTEQKIGELNIKESQKVNLSWKDGNYEYTLYNLYTIVETVDNPDSLIRVMKKSFISIQFTTKESKTFSQIVLDTIKKFEDIIPLLGILGKKRINWYELEASVVASPKKATVLEISAKKQNLFVQGDQQFSSWRDISVTEEALKNKVVDMLIVSLETHKDREIITRAIEYLLSSYEDDYLFSKLVAAYTSFETLVDGLSTSNKIGETLHGEQYKKLYSVIDSYLTNEVKDGEVRMDVLNKIPELKRTPIKKLFSKLFNEKDYPLTRFMFTNTYWKKNMGELISRRNSLIHAGKLKQEHYADLLRLHLLLQIWILQLLNCPSEYLNEYLANPIRNVQAIR